MSFIQDYNRHRKTFRHTWFAFTYTLEDYFELPKFVRHWKRRIGDFYGNWFYHRFINRYHVLTLTKRVGYADVRERLVDANFVLFNHYLIKEDVFNRIVLSNDEVNELVYLYCWYNYRWLRKDEIDPLCKLDNIRTDNMFKFIPVDPNDPSKGSRMERNTTEEQDRVFQESGEFERNIEDECDAALTKLISLRQTLWT